MTKTKRKKVEWWNDNGGFFGEKYMKGDDSIEGFIPGKIQDLESRTQREVDGIINLLDGKIYSLLDLPCGYGRHSKQLSKMGMHVVGMDINDILIKYAKHDTKAQIVKGDMRNIGVEHYEKYDAIINMWYSFGFFEDEKDNTRTMQEFYNALKQCGQLLLHTDVSPEILSGGKYRLKETRTLKEGNLVLEEWYDQKTKRMHGIWIVNSKQLTPYSVRIYSKDEFETMAKNSGFSDIRFYGSFEKDSFTPQSSELIMVARK
jgi:SAM-dependent methyltransferase